MLNVNIRILAYLLIGKDIQQGIFKRYAQISASRFREEWKFNLAVTRTKAAVGWVTQLSGMAAVRAWA